jgi:hypothetical protein
MLPRGVGRACENGASLIWDRLWRIASFCCDAEFGRYRGLADIDQAAPINLDL